MKRRAGRCECGALVQTRLTRDVTCLDCLLQAMSTARSHPAAQLERAELAEWMERSGFRPEHALRDPDSLIGFMHWCERAFPERCTAAHLEELYVQIRGFIAPAIGDNPRNARELLIARYLHRLQT